MFIVRFEELYEGNIGYLKTDGSIDFDWDNDSIRKFDTEEEATEVAEEIEIEAEFVVEDLEAGKYYIPIEERELLF